MNKIKILSPEQAVKIAAGEVVERPANIIKECIENSIDASATKIIVMLEQAGKKLIKIIDNGCGMSPDDAKLSVAAHATSKLSSVEDLEQIATFGFRGEALASINSVSNLTITTKTEYDQVGTAISWKFGTFEQELPVASAVGTTLEICNLFDNIPARQKFLKKDETEFRAIITLFQAFCLDYPAIHFQLYNENVLHYNCPAVTNIADRITQLFDTHLQKQTLPLVTLENKLCSISGIISKTDYYRYDRNQIFLFVNQRWVKNIDLTKAIMRGYAGVLPAQKYPAAIIFITIDPQQVDVNIHPKKEEIKFLHPKKVENLLSDSIKATLEQQVQQHFAMPTTQPAAHQFADTPPNFVKPAPFSFLKNSQVPAFAFDTPTLDDDAIFNKATDKQPTQAPAIQPFALEFSETLQDRTIEIPASALPHFEQPITTQEFIQDHESTEQADIRTERLTDLTIIGQYKKTYILFEKDNALTFVDQHAAHERILYEQFKAHGKNIATIQLMFPEIIKLTPDDIMTLTTHLKILAEHGMVAEIYSDTQLLVQATPIHLKNQNIKELVLEFLGWIAEHKQQENYEQLARILQDKIFAKMACSAAIKAGDIINREQMQQLLQDLAKTSNRFCCPHGRPTFWTLPVDYLEKQFKRDYTQKANQFYNFL